MITSSDVRKSIRQSANSRIYSRGLQYYKYGNVKKWSAVQDKHGHVIVIGGEVRGSDLYDVSMAFNVDELEIDDISCTCPYGGICKHVVALGLTYANSLEGTEEINSTSVHQSEINQRTVDGHEIDETLLRKTLSGLGFSENVIPSDLLKQLLTYKNDGINTRLFPAQVEVNRVTEKKINLFDQKEYYFTLSRYRDYCPTLHKVDSSNTPSVKRLLQKNNLTQTQRDLFLYLIENNFNNYRDITVEPSKLLPLLAESGIPVREETYSYYGSNSDLGKLITIDTKPKPLRAWIEYEPVPLCGDPTKVRHDFYFRMPVDYWKKHDSSRNIFRRHGEYVICEANGVMVLHKLTPLISQLIARLSPNYDYENSKPGRDPWIENYQTRLDGKEVLQIDMLVHDVRRLMSLEQHCPNFKPVKSDRFQKSFVVDFDNNKQELRVIPIIDYGVHYQNISESVFLTRSHSGNYLAYREPFEQPGSHIITVKNETIGYAIIQKKKEIEYYRELADNALELGFTKTLRCLRRGHKQVNEYLSSSWNKLFLYALQNNYSIIFTKDKLATEKSSFRADFTADANADKDWLYFDLECYCGDEKVTLERLLEYLKSGQPFWKKADGTLVEISNKHELERLARLLQSFHAREDGGFEGKLHHASELEYVMTSSKHYNSERAKSFQKFMAEMTKGKPVKKVNLPEKFKEILRPYQKSGIEWMYFLRSYRFAGILADDMGLGKTLQTLVVLDKEKIKDKPSIVICPKTLTYNWQLEAKKFTPELKTLVYSGMMNERTTMAKNLNKYDLIIVSYGTFKKDQDLFVSEKMHFNYAILDEAQFIKNHATKNAQIAKKLNADYRLALTGTPMENSVSELWSIYDFLMPDFLGNYEHFSKHFHKPIMDKGDSHAMTHLRRKIESFMLRRVKSEVLKELPAKIEQTSQCQLSAPQNVLYQQILASVRAEVFSTVEKKGFKSSQIHILAGLTKLRQVCNHPALLIEDKKGWRKYESAKLDMCMELVEEVVEGKRKVLIFSQFTKMLDIVSSALTDHKVEHLYLSGKTNNRQGMVDKFNNDPLIQVFLISLKAGGTGLNLTAADTVIIFDPWWNPSVENQAVDRAHRIGQTKAINVYRLVTSGTIEEKIQALKMKKQQLFNSLINESGDLFNKLTWDDIRELFV